MKKWIIIVLCIMLLALGAMFLVDYFMVNCSEGLFLETRSGSGILIDENNCPIALQGFDTSGFTSGDRIWVLHDGIRETYPAQTTVFFCRKLSDGTVDQIPLELYNQLAEMGWVEPCLGWIPLNS